MHIFVKQMANQKKSFQPYSWLIPLAVVTFFALSCEKEITVDLPSVPAKIVVDGQIEQGQPPIVLLSRSTSFFEPTNLSAFEDNFVRGASVSITHNGQVEELQEICTSSLPPELLPQIENLLGIDAEILAQVDICAYTSFTLLGETNTEYNLRVEVEEEVLTAKTKINNLISLDSLYFKLTGNSDSLGFIFATISDPDTLGNAYRWFARRDNKYPAWSAHAGETKDPRFIAPLGSTYSDSFFNGLSFEFAYFRGNSPNSNKEDDVNLERGFFKIQDTVIVRGTVIDQGVYNFVVSFESSISQAGSPFASPANVVSNISGGLGVWAGYGAVYDTLVCVPVN